MLEISLVANGLTVLANACASAPVLADAEQEAALAAHLRDVRDTMRERSDAAANPTALVHVVSGRLVGSLALVGPVRRGRGRTEGAIRPGVPYAAEEAARGPEHDFPTRTLKATARERAALAERLAREIAEIVGEAI